VKIPTTEKISYDVEFSTTSQISSPSFDKDEKEFSFTVSGPSGTKGTLTVSIPVMLLDEIYSVLRGGEEINRNSWSVNRFDGKNHVTINYFHSEHDWDVRGRSSSVGTGIETASGYLVTHKWYPTPVLPNRNHELNIEIWDNNPTEPQEPNDGARYSLEISKQNNVVFERTGRTDPLTAQLQILNGTFQKSDREVSVVYDLTIMIEEFDTTRVNEAVNIDVVVVPEYSTWGIMITLVGLLILVTLITKFKPLTKKVPI